MQTRHIHSLTRGGAKYKLLFCPAGYAGRSQFYTTHLLEFPSARSITSLGKLQSPFSRQRQFTGIRRTFHPLALLNPGDEYTDWVEITLGSLFAHTGHRGRVRFRRMIDSSWLVVKGQFPIHSTHFDCARWQGPLLWHFLNPTTGPSKTCPTGCLEKRNEKRKLSIRTTFQLAPPTRIELYKGKTIEHK